MKSGYILILIGLVISFSLTGQTDNSMEICFPTTGNCVLCKIRIENAVNKLNGIEEVTWDYAEDVTYVTYDDTQVDAFEIMQVIAFVGHETEWYPASDEGYAALQGTCCYYTKVIDYSNVQVGYLGLMGIWVTPLTGQAEHSMEEIRFVPGLQAGTFTLHTGGWPQQEQMTIKAFAMNGQVVHTQLLNDQANNQVDLRHLDGGVYIITIYRNKKVVSSSKIYKH